MRRYLSLCVFLLAANSLYSQEPKPVAERLAAQNAIFDEQFEYELRLNPERATGFGDYRYNDKLDDYSLAGVAQRHKADEMFLGRLAAIPTTGFSDQEAL